MTQTNSQERMIYCDLANKIQLGFFQDGIRFPSVQEIAGLYQVSYCPAQRALKALEQDGLIRLCRGRETVVLAKSCTNYRDSAEFRQRIDAMLDLSRALKLISSALCFNGFCYIENTEALLLPEEGSDSAAYGRYLCQLFERAMLSLGSQTIMSLYYDISAFFGGSLQVALGDEYEQQALGYGKVLKNILEKSLNDCQNHRRAAGKERLERAEQQFMEESEQFLHKIRESSELPKQESFSWEPHKGRTKYCDVIAIDMIYKINKETYPVGSLLPGSTVLSDIYHVSGITIRRTIVLLNKLGVVKTFNGVGTRVTARGDADMPYRLKCLKIDNNFKAFLEAFQLLTIISEPVVRYTFPHYSAEAFHALSRALAAEGPESITATVSACLQAIVHCCPLASIREIYSRITLLLLNGSVLQIVKDDIEEIPEWPELSRCFAEGIEKGDAGQFAAAFRRLCDRYFTITKQRLLKLGVDGVDKVAAPVF